MASSANVMRQFKDDKRSTGAAGDVWERVPGMETGVCTHQIKKVASENSCQRRDDPGKQRVFLLATPSIGFSTEVWTRSWVRGLAPLPSKNGQSRPEYVSEKISIVCLSISGWEPRQNPQLERACQTLL